MLKMLLIFTFMGICIAHPTPEINTTDGQESRKVLGSRVVTSVSVIMDGVNNTKTYFSDAVGKPVAKPATPTQLASPINLLNPDRYEFYTFDDSGDLVKRLMTLDEIQGIIASGDGEPSNYYSQSLNGDTPEQRVDEVINNVQNVLKEEIQAHIPFVNKSEINGPDIGSTWNLILPAIFGTSPNAVPDNVSNALIPETLSIDKEATDTTTENEQIETSLSNVVDYSKTENSNVHDLMSTTQNIILNEDQKSDLTTISTTILKTNPTTSMSNNKAQTTTYIDVTLPPSTVQPSTLKSTEEEKLTTFYIDKTTSVSNMQLSTIKQKEEVMKTTTYVDQTMPSATMQSFTLKSTMETFSPSTIQPSTLKSILAQKEEVSAFTPTTIQLSTLKSTLAQKEEEVKETFAYVDKTYTPTTMQPFTLKSTMEISTPSTIQESTLKSTLAQKEEVSAFTPTTIQLSTLKSTMETFSPRPSTLQASTLKLLLAEKEEVKETSTFTPTTMQLSTLNSTMETSLPSTVQASTLKSTLAQNEEIKEIFAYVEKTATPSTLEPFTLKSITEHKETTAPSTTYASTIKWSMKQNEELSTEDSEIKVLTTERIATTDFLANEAKTTAILTEPTSMASIVDTTKTSQSNALILQDFIENELKGLTTLQEKTTAQLETTTASTIKEEDSLFTTTNVHNASVFDENGIADDFPVDELLNLLSSIGNRDTTVSELKTTMEITTPSQNNELDTENLDHSTVKPSVTTEQVKITTNSDQTTYITQENVQSTILVTDRIEIENATTDATVDTTTDLKHIQASLEIDKNMNAAVDDVIFQMINQGISQTTIDNLPTTETQSDFSTTSSSITDISEKNRYEEIDLENAEASTVIPYEGKTIQPIFEKLTTDIKLFTSIDTNHNEVITSTETNDHITNSVHSSFTVPIKNLKTDSLDSNYKLNNTKELIVTPTTTENYVPTEKGQTTGQPEVYRITEFSLLVNITDADSFSPITTTTTKDFLKTDAVVTTPFSTTSIEPLQLNITSKPTTQGFVSIDTITVPTKLEQQPELQVINHVSSTTEKHDTTWKLVSTVVPHKTTPTSESDEFAVDLVPKPVQGFGLEDSTSSLDADVFQFTELCNELAFSFWNSVTSGISFARSVVVSPFATTSILAMVFLGARGATSGEMNDILKLDDMVTFNPHAVFKNVVESIEVSQKSGVAASVFVKELYSDKNKGKLLQFYKERVKQFYDGYVEEVNFKEINDVIRRRTNLLVRRQTWGKVSEYLKDNSLFVRPPLAAITANIFQTDCSDASTTGRDGELHFVVLPSIRQRKLVPIPAVVYRSGFLAGYEPGLDATAVAIGSKDHTISTIFVIPGQQGISAPGDGLVRLETRLIERAFKQSAWSRLLRSLIPRPGLEVQIPRFSHKSVINATAALQRMGLKDVFNAKNADLKGLNGIAHELYLSDIIQTNTFATCGEGRIDETHHSEVYPATTNRSFRRIRKIQNYHQQSSTNGDLSDEPRDYQRSFHDPLYDPTYLSLPLQFRPRQARLPDSPRLRFDRPFLYFVRHNPTGLILHMGRFNPRLLP